MLGELPSCPKLVKVSQNHTVQLKSYKTISQRCHYLGHIVSYNPNKNGGELAVFFGKPVTHNSNENEVCRFTVHANPNSSESRVAIGVSQSPDHFLFRPERPSMYDTEFTVILSGSVLEFRSVCIFEDDEGTKTVNAKQTVQLPITPSLDQIESNGDQVTLWINRMTESSNVGDFQVHISPGY